MAQAHIYDMTGQQVGAVELEDSIFGIQPNQAVMHEAVVAHLRNRRQGTSDSKSRGEISGGGKKPWRQKGTGHARQGSTRAPHWRHGGVVHGPTPRDLHRNLPDKVSKLARRSALSSKLAAGGLKIIDNISLDTIKTKAVVQALTAMGHGSRDTVLIVLPLSRDDKSRMDRVYLSCRNIPNVTVCTTDNLSAYDLIRNRSVLLDQNALPRLVEVLKP